MTTTDPSTPSPAELEARRHEIREAHLRPAGHAPPPPPADCTTPR